MFNHILLASDGSENAVRATQEAAKIASLSKDAFIDVVYVVDFDKIKI